MICPECGNEFERSVINQKYCKKYGISMNGQTICGKHASQKRYERKRSGKRKEELKRNAKRWSDKKLNQGLCIRCGRNKPEPSNVICYECIDYSRINCH